MLDAGIVPDELIAQRDAFISIDEAIRAYLTSHSLVTSEIALLGRLMDRWKKEPLTLVNYQWAESWIRSMKRVDNMAPSTIRHYVGALARCFDWVVTSGSTLLPVNPLRLLPKRYATYNAEDGAVVKTQNKLVKVDVCRDRRLSVDEESAVRRILAGHKPEGRQRALTLHYAPAIAFLFELAIESAMRMREMYTLTLDQVDTGRRTIFLDKTKNGSKRQVPMTSIAIGAFESYVARVQSGDLAMQGFTFASGMVFPWWHGSKNTEPDAIRDLNLRNVTLQLSRQYARIFDAAACVNLTFHDLRHEATSRLFEKTSLSDLQIAKITGHTDPRVLMRYANLRGSELARMLW
ncbi:site-specific integrase [Robbsia sp. Bb-Pol-6]|uniref:Site-specific integrase n=1 Tax=Robbsia betulipollinis TaxID=2981849 RepID=A0ABT3ZPR3_9BURK|nr:site-specific integrase [Robbsia betulipollinis]MCY0388536.1 site-specific integrase [Robbsia betulipollinis]